MVIVCKLQIAIFKYNNQQKDLRNQQNLREKKMSFQKSKRKFRLFQNDKFMDN